MSQVTKRALEASLKKLLLERPLDKITVTDIAEDCGINRMTFYYHPDHIWKRHHEMACQKSRIHRNSQRQHKKLVKHKTDDNTRNNGRRQEHRL